MPTTSVKNTTHSLLLLHNHTTIKIKLFFFIILGIEMYCHIDTAMYNLNITTYNNNHISNNTQRHNVATTQNESPI